MRRIRDDEGAVAIVVALLICFLLVPLAAIAVDLGMQRVARRDMQSLSDVVALDLSRDVDGTRSTSDVLAAWGCPADAAGKCTAGTANRVGRSVARNTTTLGDPPQVQAELGCANPSTGAFAPVGGSCLQPDAVRVGSTTAVDFGLAGGRGAAHRTALGKSKKTACFHLGSFAARFSTNDSTLLQQNGGALNDLLGVNLDIASYQGLTAADVSLADLAATSQIGGVEQLLGGDITLGELLSATYTVLNAQGEPENAAALNLLNNPTAWFGGNLDADVDLGDLLGVSTTDNAALMGDVNVLDLVAGAIAVSKDSNNDGIPDNFLSLSDFGLAGVTDPAQSYINIIQGKTRVCGKVNQASGKNTQVDVHLAGNLSTIGLGSIGATTVTGTYSLDVDLGGATGTLTGPEPGFPSVHCAAGLPTVAAPDKYNVTMSSALAQAAVNVNVRLKGSTTSPSTIANVPLLNNLLNSLLGGLLGSVLKVEYDLTATFAAQTTSSPSGTVHLQVPQNSVPHEDPEIPAGVPVSVASDTPLVLPTLPAAPAITGTVTVTSSKISLLGIPLGQDVRLISFDAAMFQPLLNAVTSAVNNNAALDTLTDFVNDELADIGDVLGIGLGGADVYSEYRPECKGAELFG